MFWLSYKVRTINRSLKLKTLLLTILFVLPLSSRAEISTQNFFTVDQEQQVYRGKEPGKNIDQLTDLNITDVIIFKNDVRGEVENELATLETMGINGHHIPFHWKDIPSMKVACEQVIEALSIIKKVRAKGGSVFFHCTAGEDRTGLLAGLFKMLDEGSDQRTTFEEEMCARGYSDGNHKKPKMVTSAIERGLTPLFVAMASLVESGEITLNKLNKKVCGNLKIKNETISCKNPGR